MFRHTTLILTLLTSLLMLTSLQGCGKSPMAKAAGTYELDKEAVKTAMQAEIEKIEDPMEKSMASGALGMVDAMSMTMTLNADGTATAATTGMPGAGTASGTWTLEGSTITITMAQEGENPDTISGTLSGDVITLSPPEEEMPFDMVFKRKTDS